MTRDCRRVSTSRKTSSFNRRYYSKEIIKSAIEYVCTVVNIISNKDIVHIHHYFLKIFLFNPKSIGIEYIQNFIWGGGL